jgi:hypothetical protein
MSAKTTDEVVPRHPNGCTPSGNAFAVPSQPAEQPSHDDPHFVYSSQGPFFERARMENMVQHD